VEDYAKVETDVIQALNGGGFVPPAEGDGGLSATVAAERALGRLELVQARGLFRSVLKEDPSSPLAAAGEAFLTDHGHQRVARLKQISSEWSHLERPLYFLGISYLDVDEPGKAMETFLRCLEIRPSDANASMGLAEAFLRLGRREDSVVMALSVLKRKPADIQIVVRVISLLLRAGKFHLALAEARGASNHISGWRARWLPFILPWLHSFRLMILGRNAGTVMLVIGVIMFSLPSVGLGLGVAFIAIGSVLVLWTAVAATVLRAGSMRRQFLKLTIPGRADG